MAWKLGIRRHRSDQSSVCLIHKLLSLFHSDLAKRDEFSLVSTGNKVSDASTITVAPAAADNVCISVFQRTMTVVYSSARDLGIGTNVCTFPEEEWLLKIPLGQDVGILLIKQLRGGAVKARGTFDMS